MKARHRKMYSCLQRSWKLDPYEIHQRAPGHREGVIVGAMLTGDGGWFSIQTSDRHYCDPYVTFEIWGTGMEEPRGYVTADEVRAELSRRGGFVRFLYD